MQGVFVFCVIERFLLSVEMVFLMHWILVNPLFGTKKLSKKCRAMVRSENLGLRKTHTPKLVALLLKQLVSVPTAPFSLASKFLLLSPNARGFGIFLGYITDFWLEKEVAHRGCSLFYFICDIILLLLVYIIFLPWHRFANVLYAIWVLLKNTYYHAKVLLFFLAFLLPLLLWLGLFPQCARTLFT